MQAVRDRLIFTRRFIARRAAESRPHKLPVKTIVEIRPTAAKIPLGHVPRIKRVKDYISLLSVVMLS